MRVDKPCIEIDPETIVDGIVRCPCERNGQICNAMLGKLTPDMAQFHCDKCHVEAIVRKPVVSVQTVNGRRVSNMANPDFTAMLALLIDSESQAGATRARLADLLMYSEHQPSAQAA